MEGQPVSPPGWHPDPMGEAEYRYWDGSQWTEHVAYPRAAPAPEPPPPPPPAPEQATPVPEPAAQDEEESAAARRVREWTDAARDAGRG